jgi:hypothetical protein
MRLRLNFATCVEPSSATSTAALPTPPTTPGSGTWPLASLSNGAFRGIHHGQGELLDQIFVSGEYFPREASNGTRRLPVKVDSRIETIRSIGDNPSARVAELQPDHAPVSAAFEFD